MNYQLLNKVICVLSLSFFLVACGGGSSGPDSGGDACSALNARVFNGETCSAEVRTPIVALYAIAENGDKLQAVSICTGTLVTVDDILTSGHCIAAPFAVFGDSVKAFVAAIGSESNREYLLVSRGRFHPRWRGEIGSPYDLAMLTLEDVPQPPIGPVPLLISQATLPGQDMSTYGYGTNNLGEIGTLKSAEIRIEALVDGNLIATLLGSGASVCSGDSGGPVLQVIDGVTSLVGVNSFNSANPSGKQCSTVGAQISGFVDIQLKSTVDFIRSYAPDVPVN